MLPNLVAPIIVYTTLVIPQNILFEAALSFLGVGIQPPDASWGQMLADATTIFDSAWWYMFFPGAALLLTVLAFNLLGDGLHDALNPRAGVNEKRTKLRKQAPSGVLKSRRNGGDSQSRTLLAERNFMPSRS